eukprot:CAMPEP_0114989774 /NCGR_PEP_ID=MMETSP0216-20121206/10389_1 /TAXON_ID=223996 /ORGANISM="Protocruzia adherens, Strain Boccale" /LENGTH=183 /DNA_ID=CAMNT_0002352799 /DNA_START=46 /DNA_END=597 /DNA_ORIENTATION=-
MGCNLSFLQKVQATKSKKERRILILGLDGAGKSSIMFQLKLGEFVETVPTIGLNVETIEFKNLELTIWDVGGQVRTLWKHYYSNIDAVIFVVDSADKDRIDTAKEELHSLVNDPELTEYALLIYFNKNDLEDKMSTDELKQKLGIDDLKKDFIFFQECSAKKGEGVSDGLEQMSSYLESEKSE